MSDVDLSYALPTARALAETAVGVTLADARAPDFPIVYANEAFSQLTGYAFEEIEGRNCRFLQGAGTDPDTVRRMRQGLAARRRTRVTLLNYRADGSAFYNELLIAPVRDDDGTVTHFVGMQIDVTHSVQFALRLREERDLLRAEVDELASLRDVLTPPSLPEVGGFDLATRYVAADRVTGDFFVVASSVGGTTIVAVGDAIGHGVAAATQASFVRASLLTFAGHTSDPARLLELANASVLERTAHDGLFVTAACVALDADGRGRVALAGHPAPLRLDSGDALEVERYGLPLGVALDATVGTADVQLGPGEGLLLYTDGLTEARRRPDGDARLGEDAVVDALRGMHGQALEPVLDGLTRLARSGAPEGPEDDLCLVALRRR